MQDTPQTFKKPVPVKYAQSGPSDGRKKPSFYQSLALVALKCFNQCLVQNQQARLQEYLKNEFKPLHISLLSWLFANTSMLPSVMERTLYVHQADEFIALVSDVINEIVVSGLIHEEDHGALLRDLGLHHGCWPLTILQPTLSLLARTFIYRLQHSSSESRDDPLILSIWKGLVYLLIKIVYKISFSASSLVWKKMLQMKMMQMRVMWNLGCTLFLCINIVYCATSHTLVNLI